ncbi:uncharacterized protein N7482_004542 [Penicillium canariense]|uniref:Uncharacterized protein n=1 Tax=Penicillium canariense TaxID=189055 RepID=A0A9W9I8Y1_9EURO|nr:uncharacterized protein N7482_004542 [Penicillium canariense]KAJ5168948.1 hypothetical protein N7482_004542 [Penicillium canariense]
MEHGHPDSGHCAQAVEIWTDPRACAPPRAKHGREIIGSPPSRPFNSGFDVTTDRASKVYPTRGRAKGGVPAPQNDIIETSIPALCTSCLVIILVPPSHRRPTSQSYMVPLVSICGQGFCARLHSKFNTDGVVISTWFQHQQDKGNTALAITKDRERTRCDATHSPKRPLPNPPTSEIRDLSVAADPGGEIARAVPPSKIGPGQRKPWTATRGNRAGRTQCDGRSGPFKDRGPPARIASAGPNPLSGHPPFHPPLRARCHVAWIRFF